LLICDTSGLLAYFDDSEEDHAQVKAAIDGEAGPFIVSPFVLAELDYLLAARVGVRAQLTALAEIAGGAWKLPCLEAADVRRARDLVEGYQDQAIGLADASLVVLASRHKTERILTLDHRRFRVLRTAEGTPFTLLPA
jgi:uncharacterized protein